MEGYLANEFFCQFLGFPYNKTSEYVEPKHENFYYWRESGGIKTLELHIPGFSKNEVNVEVKGTKIIVNWGTEDESISEANGGNFTFNAPEGYVIPETVKVKDGIFTMEFKKKEEKVHKILVV